MQQIFPKIQPLKFKNLIISGCMALITILSSLNAFTQLRANFSSSTTSGCAPLLISFIDQSTGNPTAWKWTLGNGTTSFVQNPSVTYVNPGQYSVKLVIQNNRGKDSITKIQYINVYAKPTINFSASAYNGCAPATIFFTDLSTPGNGNTQTRQWDFGDGTFSTLTNPSHTYSSSGNFNVSLRVTNTYGCVASATQINLIHINPKPVANFSYSALQNCGAPFTVNFQNQSTGTSPLSFTWNFGDGSSSSDANPVHTYLNPGTYSVKLITTNSQGCVDSILKTNLITVANNITKFNCPDTVCINTSFQINNLSSSATCSWNFGNGNTSTSQNPTVSYSNSGTYNIKLVNNFGGCIDSLIKTITVLASPIANFNANPNQSCALPFVVAFNNTSSNTGNFIWNFGDGTSSMQANPTHIYTSAGNFDVKLICTSIAGCTSSITKTQYIKIQLPVAAVNHLPKKGCAPLTCNFTSSVISNDSVVSYHWDFGDGNSSNVKTPSHTFAAGVYDITLIITTLSGCTDTVFYPAAVKAGVKPHTTFGANPRDVCAQFPVLFSDLTPVADSVDQWYWSFGDGTHSNLQNPPHAYSDTGLMNVQLVTFNYACPDTLFIPNYVHISPPIASFVSNPNCNNRLTRSFSDRSIGADTWLWHFGDGATSALQNPSHTYASSGNYNVALTVHNNTTGCDYTYSTNLLIIDEHPDFIASDTSVCKGNSIVFNATQITPSYFNSIIWNFGDNTTGSGTPVTKTYNSTGVYNIKLFTTDKNGCKDTVIKNRYIKINGPIAKFSASNAITCAATSVNFLDSSTTDGRNNITTWIWNYGDGRIDTLNSGNTSHLYNLTGNYNVSLKIFDTKGCSSQTMKSNFVSISKPKAIFFTNDTLSCPFGSVRFTNSSTGNGLTYLWKFGDGTTSTVQNPIHNYTNSGTFSVSLYVTSSIGCKDTLIKTNYIKIIAPNAGFTVSDSVGTCPPLIVNFSNTSNNYISQVWDFGDGTSTNTNNPSHFYSASGTFIAKLTITSSGGCIAVFTKTITVHGPTGSFLYNPLTGCAPLSVQFNANTQGTNLIVWDYSDGNTNVTSQNSISHIYDIEGNYLPRVILKDTTSGCTLSIVGRDTIKVYDIKAAFGVSTQNVCDAGIVQFSNSTSSNDQITSYTWNFGDGTHSNQVNPNHLYNINGSYLPQLIVTTQHGCKDTINNSVPISISTTPSAVSHQTPNVCAGGNIQFSSTLLSADTNNLHWNWTFGNGNSYIGMTPPTQTYSNAGIFSVQLIVSNLYGCADTVNSIAESYAIPRTYAGIDTISCKGRGVRLIATGADFYTWSPTVGLNCSNCSSPLANPDSAIQYIVSGRNEHGCFSKDSVKVTVQYPFQVSGSNRDTICRGSSVLLSASGADNYYWYPSNGLTNARISNPTASPTQTTFYQAVGYDNHHCFEDTVEIPVIVYDIPTVEAGDDISINVGQTITITPQISNDVITANWTPSNSILRNIFPSITVKPNETTTYKVEVTNGGGCKSTDQLTVNVLCNGANLFIPNTFSPNNDGMNDIFYPRGTGIFTIKKIQVFSRWGEIVFEKFNIKANDATKGWDGTFKGKKLTPDVYVYLVEVICDNNSTLVFKGNVSLMQ